MKQLSLSIALAVALNTSAIAQDKPSLIVQITVDGLRGDLLHRYMDSFGEGGFRRLTENGVWYTNAHHRHANTETIVGHTTLATGAHPSEHGMIGNAWFDRAGEEPWVLILMMVGILIAAGCVMETTPNIVILAPILMPLAENIGMNEIQFCIMMITALGVGFITPPLGLNLFVVSGITGESILKIAYWAVPFVFFMLVVTILIAYVPVISTVLLPDIYK